MQITKLEPANETMICIDSDTDDVWCNRLQKIVADKYSRLILDTISTESKSVTEIFLETGIPISTIYRRLQDLLDARLLHISGQISKDGKKLFLYKSKAMEIHTTFNGQTIEVRLIMVNKDEPKV